MNDDNFSRLTSTEHSHPFSPLILGTAGWGARRDVKYQIRGDVMTDDEIDGLLCYARGFGITTIAVASQSYGDAFKRVARVIRTRQKEYWKIMLFVGEREDPGTYDFSPLYLKMQLEEARRDLDKQASVTSLVLHVPRDDAGLDEGFDSLQQLRDEGYAGLLGASIHTLAGFVTAISREAQVVSLPLISGDLLDPAMYSLCSLARKTGVIVTGHRLRDGGHSLRPCKEILAQAYKYVGAAILGVRRLRHLDEWTEAAYLMQQRKNICLNQEKLKPGMKEIGARL